MRRKTKIREASFQIGAKKKNKITVEWREIAVSVCLVYLSGSFGSRKKEKSKFSECPTVDSSLTFSQQPTESNNKKERPPTHERVPFVLD